MALAATEGETLPHDPRAMRNSSSKRADIDDFGFVEDFVLRVDIFPILVPTSVIRRLLFVRLIHAVCSSSNYAKLLFSEAHKAVMQKGFVLLFKALSSPWEDVVNLSQKALGVIIALRPAVSADIYDRTLPKEIMQKSLQPVLSNLQDARRLPLNVIRSLEGVLRLVTNKSFLQFGDRILDHLRIFADPERIAAMKIWLEDEENVASALMNLLHLLPWNQPGVNAGEQSNTTQLLAFLNNYVRVIVELERVRIRFRCPVSIDSPFLLPLARFLCRFPIESIFFFFSAEQMASPEVRIYLCSFF
jgi:transformation/transcription domain-associated protein